MNTNGNNRVKEQEKTSNVCEKTSNVYENMGRSVYVINFFYICLYVHFTNINHYDIVEMTSRWNFIRLPQSQQQQHQLH